jgi:hypothetical protein
VSYSVQPRKDLRASFAEGSVASSAVSNAPSILLIVALRTCVAGSELRENMLAAVVDRERCKVEACLPPKLHMARWRADAGRQPPAGVQSSAFHMQ